MKTNQNIIKAHLIVKVLLLGILSLTVLNTQAQRRHKKKHVYVAHHKYSKLPRWGVSVTVVPKKAVVVKRSGVKYHYHSGVYYRKVNKKYVVVKAPTGIFVNSLPKERIKIVANGKNYFYYYGSFYKKTKNGFVIIDPPVGAKVDALPEGYEIVTYNGKEFYKFEGVFFKEIVTEQGEVFYKVVGKRV